MKTELLIIGAGPFGLAIAAQAQHEQIEHVIVGRPMEFWRENMPKGMFLRSACDWHFDPQNVHTIEEVKLTNGEAITIDKIILATGYKVDIARLPVLAAGNLLEQIETRNGFPVLDDHFETSVPGLFITSMPAMQDFGPFFGFTNSVRTSARLIIARLCSESARRRFA